MLDLSLAKGLRTFSRCTLALRLCLGVFLADIFIVAAGIASLTAFHDDNYEVGNVPDYIVAVAAALFPLLLIITTIALLGWVYAGMSNLAHAGVTLRFTPTKAVGSFFLPFGFYRPLHMMQELASRSCGRAPPAHGDVSWLITAWWGCCLSGIFLLSIAAATDQDDPATAAALGGCLGLIISALCLLRIVRDAAVGQDRWPDRG